MATYAEHRIFSYCLPGTCVPAPWGCAATEIICTVQVPRKGPIRVATDYPLVAELLTNPAFEVTDRSDEASADVLVALRPVRDFYSLPRSVALCAGWLLSIVRHRL